MLLKELNVYDFDTKPTWSVFTCQLSSQVHAPQVRDSQYSGHVNQLQVGWNINHLLVYGVYLTTKINELSGKHLGTINDTGFSSFYMPKIGKKFQIKLLQAKGIWQLIINNFKAVLILVKDVV